jgi:hypothetical protein
MSAQRFAFLKSGAKLQKNIDVGKFYGEKVWRKWIL